MSDSHRQSARVAIVSTDEVFSGALAGWIAENDPELDVVIRAVSWGDLLGDPLFPTDLVVLDAASSKRSSVESRVRTSRTSGSAVLVLVSAEGTEDPRRAIAAGAFCVLDKTVPFGLIGEMARGAMGLPLG